MVRIPTVCRGRVGKCIRACIRICDLMRDGEVEEREGGRGVRLVNVAVGGCVELEVDSLSAYALRPVRVAALLRRCKALYETLVPV